MKENIFDGFIMSKEFCAIPCYLEDAVHMFVVDVMTNLIGMSVRQKISLIAFNLKQEHIEILCIESPIYSFLPL